MASAPANVATSTIDPNVDMGPGGAASGAAVRGAETAAGGARSQAMGAAGAAGLSGAAGANAGGAAGANTYGSTYSSLLPQLTGQEVQERGQNVEQKLGNLNADVTQRGQTLGYGSTMADLGQKQAQAVSAGEGGFLSGMGTLAGSVMGGPVGGAIGGAIGNAFAPKAPQKNPQKGVGTGWQGYYAGGKSTQTPGNLLTALADSIKNHPFMAKKSTPETPAKRLPDWGAYPEESAPDWARTLPQESTAKWKDAIPKELSTKWGESLPQERTQMSAPDWGATLPKDRPPSNAEGDPYKYGGNPTINKMTPALMDRVYDPYYGGKLSESYAEGKSDPSGGLPGDVHRPAMVGDRELILNSWASSIPGVQPLVQALNDRAPGKPDMPGLAARLDKALAYIGKVK